MQHSRVMVQQLEDFLQKTQTYKIYPSHDKAIRMIFTPGIEYNNVEFKDNYYDVNSTDDIKVSENNWKRVKDVRLGDTILNSMGQFDEVVKIEQFDRFYEK